ncbi:hypothetical protein P0E82_14295, partial [Enterococcus faecalis]|uniref:hypothetical protein n=1 Tax=Enterococcus faecalis TaxID=1351 RepID=UPI0025B09134
AGLGLSENSRIQCLCIYFVLVFIFLVEIGIPEAQILDTEFEVRQHLVHAGPVSGIEQDLVRSIAFDQALIDSGVNARVVVCTNLERVALDAEQSLVLLVVQAHELFVLFRELFEFRVPDTIQFQT